MNKDKTFGDAVGKIATAGKMPKKKKIEIIKGKNYIFRHEVGAWDRLVALGKEMEKKKKPNS